jgi:hypothetical protein
VCVCENGARAVRGAAHGWRADSGPCTRCSPSALAARALSALHFGRTRAVRAALWAHLLRVRALVLVKLAELLHPRRLQ